ncbi:glucose-1-phosphate thymidylyltransferase [Aeropyrum pernix K1]|uniref:Glucose-1-phosphate thymidylyltransferase n=1 Tax=Aeropyrum pernix (strain ATCC 700893 / DSM 11879 / JCM 9820 / NBRC 100138 / K1) TaxID=272557 RepID=Q9YCT0_AERPE|nr:glucose-1-phosphate thymidylyltransferase [Aeropyrum pernix]BAA80167.1 glucose-1-phosphate thymidylyltransferase [Aeropyrum pernix K1]
MVKGLILAAGEGSRLRPFTFSRPKHLIPLLGKPIIQYAIDDLVSINVRDIGVVVGYFGDKIKEFLGEDSRFGAKFTYIVQKKRLGIAHAIYRAIKQGFIDKEFIVYLGDNILSGGISRHVKSWGEAGSEVHILLTKVRDPGRFGIAVLRDGKILKLVEKPQEHISDLAVVGVYMFRDPELVAKAFSTLKPSWRGEYEITDLIQWFVDKGYKVTFSLVTGWWKDVGTYEGLLDAIYLLLDNVKPRVEGKIEGEVRGRVVVEEGAIVEGTVHGPAYIGKDVYIGRSGLVEHYVSMEQGSRIISGTVARSMILDESELYLNKARLVDSVVGPKSIIKSNREIYGDIKLVISDYSKVFL